MAWLKIALILLVVVAVSVLAEDEPPKKYPKGKNPYYDFNEEPGYGYRHPPKKVKINKIPRKPLLSAWGIIFVILSFVALGVAAYYFYLFYPIYFKKPRRYDNMAMVSKV